MRGRAIQSKLTMSRNNQQSPEGFAKIFAKLMLAGEVTATVKLLEKSQPSGILNMNKETLSELKEKHPAAKPLNPTVMLGGEIPLVDPIIFQTINEETILKAALLTKGAAGPSGLDANNWRQILLSKNFGKHGINLRSSIAKLSRVLCTEELQINGNANKETNSIIPLDKNPGVRHIGIGEVLRRIIGKSIISVIRPDIVESAGNLQLCAGQPSGREAAAHAME